MLLTLLNVRKNDDPFRRWLDKKLTEHPSIKERRVTFASLYQRTKIYLAVVACDLNDDRSEPVIFDKDTEPDISVAVAVRASISIPGVFMPVPNLFKGQELVDGGLLLNFPVAILHSKTQEKDCPLIGQPFQHVL
jgi:NTE family protein